MPHTSRAEHYRREVSRIEGFSDAVFAFAVTLLVVSLEVPHTFTELWAAMQKAYSRLEAPAASTADTSRV